MKKVMTYGEAMVYAKENCLISNGLAKLNTPIHKPRMSYAQACEYYSKKLYRLWLAQMDQNIPTCKRDLYLNYLLGRTNARTRTNHEIRRQITNNEMRRVSM